MCDEHQPGAIYIHQILRGFRGSSVRNRGAGSCSGYRACGEKGGGIECTILWANNGALDLLGKAGKGVRSY